jgi:hypothetical protein
LSHRSATSICWAKFRAEGPNEELLADAVELQVFRTCCLCLSLPQLIRAKRAAGRPEDLEALAELEAIEEESS